MSGGLRASIVGGSLGGLTAAVLLRDLGGVQLYLRDPAGNLVEIVCRRDADLSPELREEMVNRMDKYPQTEEQRSATLFLLPPDG